QKPGSADPAATPEGPAEATGPKTKRSPTASDQQPPSSGSATTQRLPKGPKPGKGDPAQGPAPSDPAETPEGPPDTDPPGPPAKESPQDQVQPNLPKQPEVTEADPTPAEAVKTTRMPKAQKPGSADPAQTPADPAASPDGPADTDPSGPPTQES